MPEKSRRANIFIVSDATGITAERVASAVLTQFKPLDISYERFPFVTSRQELANILAKAEYEDGLIIYSLASEELRRDMEQLKREYSAESIDLMGPLLTRVGKIMQRLPNLRPGKLEHVVGESVRLAESIDFTLSHDDGQRPDDLHKANLIIAGVSRTSKTPTSLFISCNHGLKVANVPIVKDMEPPQELFAASCRKIGFTISPARLAFIRRQRFSQDALPIYSDAEYIKQELNYCRRLFQRIPGLQTIDVTNMSIEETAHKIMS